MSSANKLLRTKMLTVIILVFFFLVSGLNSLLTKTKTLEGMKANLFSKLSSRTFFQKEKIGDIKEIMNQLIELGQQDIIEKHQRTSFEILIEKTRNLVDEMLQEQRDEDIQFRNVTNLLMKYHIRQTHALEFVQDKYTLMNYFIDFVNSIDETEGQIDIKTDYSKLTGILLDLQKKYKDYAQIQKMFSEKFSVIYDELQSNSHELTEFVNKETNPYLLSEMTNLVKQLALFRTSLQKVEKSNYLYNTDPTLEIDSIKKYIEYFEKQSNNETRTITPHFFPSFEKEENDAKSEIVSLANLLSQAEEAMKITTDSIQSNYQEYEANKKTRKEVITVIYDILDLMNKRAKKIKGYQLKYIEETIKKLDEKTDTNDYKNIALENILSNFDKEENETTPLPEIPDDLEGIEDPNAQAPNVPEDPIVYPENNAELVAF